MPEELEEKHLVDEYLKVFDLSLELYSSLQAAGQDGLEAYATLLGHKIRFQLSCSLGYLQQLQDATKSQPLQQIYGQMVNLVAESHPIIGSLLKPAPKNK